MTVTPPPNMNPIVSPTPSPALAEGYLLALRILRDFCAEKMQTDRRFSEAVDLLDKVLTTQNLDALKQLNEWLDSQLKERTTRPGSRYAAWTVAGQRDAHIFKPNSSRTWHFYRGF